MLDPSRAIAKLLSEDKRYKFDAYVFVFEALNFAQDELHMGTETTSEGAGEDDPEAVERHVTGQELCEAIRRYALRQYGYMAKTVLNSWGIRCTGDFGEIVFNLIRIGQMKKTKHDDRRDFDDVFDFETALQEEFKITLPD
jgi:uncharacterized repeat protein (TIGR04138 family)